MIYSVKELSGSVDPHTFTIFVPTPRLWNPRLTPIAMLGGWCFYPTQFVVQSFLKCFLWLERMCVCVCARECLFVYALCGVCCQSHGLACSGLLEFRPAQERMCSAELRWHCGYWVTPMYQSAGRISGSGEIPSITAWLLSPPRVKPARWPAAVCAGPKGIFTCCLKNPCLCWSLIKGDNLPPLSAFSVS